MLDNQRQNYHHSNLPAIGEVGYLVDCFRVERWTNKPIYLTGKPRKCIVESFPLTDSSQWKGRFYSYGIHTVNVRFLDNGQTATVSGMYFQGIPC